MIEPFIVLFFTRATWENKDFRTYQTREIRVAVAPKVPGREYVALARGWKHSHYAPENIYFNYWTDGREVKTSAQMFKEGKAWLTDRPTVGVFHVYNLYGRRDITAMIGIENLHYRTRIYVK